MYDFGIMCAMEEEFDLLYGCLYNRKRIAERVYSATTEKDGGKTVLVSVCGIGKVNAAVCAVKMIESGVMDIISVGVAGAADESVNVGDIVIGNSYCYHDVWCGKPNQNGQIQGCPSVFPSSFVKWVDKIQAPEGVIHLGTIATGDWFVQDRETVERIKCFLPAAYNIVAVDMESAAIAQVCNSNNVPFMSIRVISDNPLLPGQQEQYDNFWGVLAERSFNTLYNIIR